MYKLCLIMNFRASPGMNQWWNCCYVVGVNLLCIVWEFWGNCCTVGVKGLFSQLEWLIWCSNDAQNVESCGVLLDIVEWGFGFLGKGFYVYDRESVYYSRSS